MGCYVENEDGTKFLKTFATKAEADEFAEQMKSTVGVKRASVHHAQEIGSVVSMPDGTQYEVRKNGWRRVRG